MKTVREMLGKAEPVTGMVLVALRMRDGELDKAAAAGVVVDDGLPQEFAPELLVLVTRCRLVSKAADVGGGGAVVVAVGGAGLATLVDRARVGVAAGVKGGRVGLQGKGSGGSAVVAKRERGRAGW